jgi:hypothetical protein
MLEVCLTFLLCATGSSLFAFLMGLTGDLVLELARELMYACRFTRRRGTLALGSRSRRELVFGVRVLSCEIVQCHGPVHARVLLTLFGTQRVEKLFVVIRMCPDTTRGVCFRVDEELVRGLWVKATYPARR